MPSNFRVAVGALAVLHLALALGSSWSKSVTMDEAGHVAAGASIWATGDVRLYPADPPLVRLIATSPFVLLRPTVPLDEGWSRGNIVQFQDEFVRANAARYAGLVRAARVPVAILGALTVLLAALEAAALAGGAAGIAAACVLAFEPTFAAHAGLATVDVGASFFCLLWLALVRRWMASPTRPLLILAGLAGGLAVGAKFSALILAPYVAARLLLKGRSVGRMRPVLGALGAFFLLGLLALDACYLFRTLGPRQARPTRLMSMPLRLLETPGLSAVPLPLPNRFLEGLDDDLRFRSGEYGREVRQRLSTLSYLHGVLVKWTLPALALALLWPLAARVAGAPALGPGLFFCLVVSLAHQMYGLRFLLPAVPLFAVASGVAAALWLRAGSARQRVALALLLLHASSAWLAVPDLIPYRNQAGGALESLGAPLRDADVDWGQDLPELRAFQEEEGIGEIPLLYFGAVDPAVYGVRWRYPDPGADRGWVAVSVSYLRGQRLHVQGGRLVAFKDELLSIYRNATPARLLGGSIALFRWPPEGSARRLGHRGAPPLLLTPQGTLPNMAPAFRSSTVARKRPGPRRIQG